MVTTAAIAVSLSVPVAVAQLWAPSLRIDELGPVGASSRPTPQTLVVAQRAISAFAQDGNRIAWVTDEPFDPSPATCRQTVRVRDLTDGTTYALSRPKGPTCGWGEGFERVMALAGKRALWAYEMESMRVYSTTVISGAISGPERRVGTYEQAKTTGDPNHPWPVYVPLAAAGDSRTLVWIDLGAHVVRVVDHPSAGAGSAGASAVAAAGDSFAFARPQEQMIEIRNSITGAAQSSFHVDGRVTAMALSPTRVAMLVQQNGNETELLVTSRRGTILRAATVPANDAQVSLAGARVVYLDQDLRRIHAFDISTGKDKVVASSSGPVGLSIEGLRVAWAETVSSHDATHGFIRAITLPPG